jgi:hypothetical protein
MEAFGELLGALLAAAAGFFLGALGMWFIPRFLQPPRRSRVITCLGVGLGLGVVFFVLAMVGYWLLYSLKILG